MTEDDFMTAIDGLEFDEKDRTWTLEVDRVDDGAPNSFCVTVRIHQAGEMHFEVPRNRRMKFAVLQDQVIGVARDVVGGRRVSGVRTAL